MSNEEMKKWIDEASYVELLYRWRFEPVGSPWFNGTTGRYFAEAMVHRKPSAEEHSAASKQVGWDVIA